MPSLRDIKRRIKSIQSTRKITRAMQMVSASKMRKAQSAVTNSRTYADLAWELINSVIPAMPGGRQAQVTRGFLQTFPEAEKIGIVLLTTNRGLVGSLNSNLAAKIKEIPNSEIISEIITYGKNARTIAGRLQKNVVADFPKIDRTISAVEIYPLARYISDIYQTGEYQKIFIVYNHFVSTLIQKSTIKQLLPFIGGRNLTRPSTTLSDIGEGRGEVIYNAIQNEYLFEPAPDRVINHLLPRIIESQIYQAILESDASEHSARMVMMKNATEAAGDLIFDLTLTYNQVRQNKITTELAEITAGRIALE
ncbi:MAG: ATP synthase F1 subunit gamma [Candidatus Doudnabacteria bacterium]|nr:ATP synthase F1 subunit gamma [Candidatus Doudnabacteria bacterium]